MIFKCTICQKEFNRAPAHAARVETLVCSHKCHAIAQTGSGNKMWQGGKVTTQCPQCGNQNQSNKGKLKKFCNMACRTTYYKIHGHPRSIAKTKIQCSGCGKTILKNPSQLKERNFCSRKCASYGHRQKITGQDNGRFRSGRWTGYAAEFRDASIIVRKRTNGACVTCNRPENYPKHPVHHVNGNKFDNQLQNLVTLCTSCHKQIHAKIEIISAPLKQKVRQHLSIILELEKTLTISQMEF